MYVCMYVSVTLRNPIISRATRKRSITCASVTLRNVTAVPACHGNFGPPKILVPGAKFSVKLVRADTVFSDKIGPDSKILVRCSL